MLKQNRWEVENYVGGEPVVLGEGDVKRDQTLYVAHCSDTVIQVRGDACQAGSQCRHVTTCSAAGRLHMAVRMWPVL